MTTHVDVEDISSTKSEKFLAVVLAAFLLIGSIWFYVKVDDWMGGSHAYSTMEQRIFEEQGTTARAQERADQKVERERSDVTLAKDALDIALAKGEPTDRLERAYDVEVQQLQSAQERADTARAAAINASKRAEAVEKRHSRLSRSAARQWAIAGVRLGFIASWFAVSLRVVSVMRRRQSRFLPLGFAGVAPAVITALVFATDYITDYIDPLDLGPIILSIFGAVVTVATFIGLQRWLAARIPGRRVRNGECPYCGFPVREGSHCEGCGRAVVAPCAACGAARRVGSPHCSSCGAN
jgi:hypothetical protein